MKQLFLLLVLQFLISNSNAQEEINYIKYKQDCNKAYLFALQDSNYQKAIDHLEGVHKKYHFLAAEEYLLKAYAYKEHGNSLLCAENVKLTWSNYAFDFSYIFEIPALSPSAMVKGFNDEEQILMNEGYANYSKLSKHPHADSIIAKLTFMDSIDRIARDQFELDSTSWEKVKQMDSLNGIEFKKIIEQYGFPGEHFYPGQSSTCFRLLVHFADYPAYFKSMDPILYNEVKNGRMSPTYYLFWLDRHIFNTEGKSMYGMIVPPGTKLDKHSKIMKRRLKFGLNYGFPLPPKALSYS